MEAILRSVLLRQEQMEMQWDAEFEQQKQLFHINTSTLIDMLPIQPRKKRLKVEGRVPVPSHDKENLVGLQGFVPTGTTLKSPKTKAPHSRGLAKRDLNTRFRDHDVKDVGRVAAKPADTQPSLRNCLEAESPQQNASIVHAIKSSNQGSIGTSVRVEGDVGDVHVSPSTDVFLSGENRKRLRGEQEEDIVLQNCVQQNVMLSNDGEEIREQNNQTAVVNNVEKKLKFTKALKGGKSKECAVEVEAHELSCRDTHLVRCNAPEIVCKVKVEADMETCRDTEAMRSEIVSKVIEPEIVSKGPSRKGRAKGATTVSQEATVVPEIVSKEPLRRGRAKQTSVPQVTQRVTRSRARMVDGGVESKPERVTRSRVVESVVGSEPEICETMPCTEVAVKESAQQEVKLEGLCEADVQDRFNQVVERHMETHGRISSVELSEAGNDALASEIQVLPTVGLTGRSSGAEFSVVVKNDSGEHPVDALNMLATEQQRSESDGILDKVDIEANEKRSRHTMRGSMQDVVMKTSEVSLEKEPDKSGNSKKEASRMDMAREHVKSDEVSPVKYSETRAIEEAMRCSLEQEFHPDVTLTLNRWQFRKRLSPRSKARARRWRSDVATNGVNYARGQSSDAPAASPSRVVSSRDLSLEGGAFEAFPDAQSLEVPVQGVESSISLGAGKTDDQVDTVSQQEPASESDRGGRRSISSLCNEILSQDFNDREVGDSAVECEIIEKADEQNGNTRLPLLQSIYTLSKACQNDLVGTRSFLEEEEQQQVHSLIVSAKKIMEQLSSKAVIPQPTTPASDNPAPNNSRFHGRTSLYPDRFRLFLTPGSSPAATQIVPPSSSNYLSSAAPGVAGDIKSTTSPQTKHLMRETIERAVSRTPHMESGVRADNVASPAPSRPPNSGKLTTTSGTRDNHQAGEDENAFKSSPATGSGSKSFAVDAPIQVDLASDLISNRTVPGPSTLGPVILLPVSQTVAMLACDGSTQLTIERVARQSEFPLGLEAFTETEKFSESRSRFYALSKDCIGTSATAKGVPDLRGDGPESLISYPSNPPSPVPNLAHSLEYASKDARLSVEKTPRSQKGVGFGANENQMRAVVAEEERSIPCSPIFVVDQREKVDFQRDGTSEPAEEPVARTESMANARPASMLRIEPQCSSNLISDVPSILPSNSNLPRSNLVTSLRSFVPLVQQQQPAAPYPNGKRDVKVKALEAAEAAKRLAEQKEFEKQERKKAAELAKREKQERAAQEKLAKREKAAQEKLKQQESRAERENEEANKRKTVAAGSNKPVLSDSNHSQGVNSQNVLLKVKKTHDLKLKMDQEKQERLLEEQRRKEEEWRKKEAENAARKRKLEVAEKKEREEKKRRQEETMKGHREMEERQRSELEKKTQKQKFMEELEKERRAIEEDLKRQRRVAKEKENEQRRKKEEEKELAWLEEKEAIRKRKEEAAKQMKLLETEGRQHAAKIRRPSEDPAMPSAGPYHSFMASLHIAMGVGEGARRSGVNSDPQRVSSLVGHPLRVLQHSAEGAGALRNSQAALRVPRTTPESVLVVSNVILGTGKPLTRTPPEALGNVAPASVAVSSGGGSTAKVLRERISVLQVQPGSKLGAAAVVAGSKACQPGQVGFAGPPGGVIVQGDKGQSYEISPFRDSEDEDSEEEEKRSLKPIPQWARKENMLPQLVRQLEQDPDDIFVGANSCSLDEVFEVKGSKKRPDFKRRGSSGNWVKDCLTSQEQVQYKVTMGYLH